MVIRVPAAITRVLLPNVPRKYSTPTDSGNSSGLLMTMEGQMYSFHDSTAVRMPTVASHGVIRGSMMRLKMTHSEAPSTRAASIRSCGTSSNACLSSKMATAVTTLGRITPV